MQLVRKDVPYKIYGTIRLRKVIVKQQKRYFFHGHWMLIIDERVVPRQSPRDDRRWLGTIL